MTIQGLIGTGDFGGTIGSPDTIPAHERPTNWREGILQRFPNGHAPLVALTSVMKKKVTDDPQYQWWERELSDVRLKIEDGAMAAGTLAWVCDAYSDFGDVKQIKVGDLLKTDFETAGGYEIVRVTAVNTGTQTLTVTRGYGDTTAHASWTIGAGNDSGWIHKVGSAYEEGADTPEAVRYRPTKKYNYTQIFRNSLKATRTAMHTRLRTVDEVRDAKVECLTYHSMDMEYAFWFGTRFEDTGAGGQPERSSRGVYEWILQDAASNVKDFAGVDVSMEEIEAELLEAFRWGSQEKMGFCGNRAILAIQQMARRNASLEITPAIKEFGMDVRRLFTPFGTLVLKTHPLFNQIQSTLSESWYGLDSWLVILDMANLRYRPLRNSDTQYLPDRQNNGIDGLTSEYLTECGLEVSHAKTHYVMKGVIGGKADV